MDLCRANCKRRTVFWLMFYSRVYVYEGLFMERQTIENVSHADLVTAAHG